ncbi:MAG: hybrid sensor histidine kinase/response regulator, partial [Comamonadaceae bacterium]
MARQMREHDWAATPLGPPEQWPQALKVALRILLTSKFQMWLGWGEQVHFFYNDAYRPTLGIKHPQSLGMPAKALWPEIWDDIKDRIRTVYQQGEATWDEALLLLLERSGFPEETYHTFSYSPLLDDDGSVGGLFCAVTEDTNRVISERRLGTLRELARGHAAADSTSAVLRATKDSLRIATRDLPFSALYLFDDDGQATLAACAGLEPDSALAPSIATPQGIWDVRRVRAGDPAFVVPMAFDPATPTGPWDKPARQAVVVPLPHQGAGMPHGFLVCG